MTMQNSLLQQNDIITSNTLAAVLDPSFADMVQYQYRNQSL